MADNHTLETLGVKVQALESADDRLRSDMHEGFAGIRSDLNNLAGLIQRRGETDWKLVVSIVSATLVFVGMMGTVVLNPLKDRLVAVERHAEREGHPYSMAAIENLEKRIEMMNKSRDEMRDIVYQNLRDRLDRIDQHGIRNE